MAEPLVQALEAWRKTRSARFGALVDAISAKEPELPPLPASKKKVDIAKWNDTEAAGDHRDFPRLATTLAAVPSPSAAERVEVLAKRDDARLVTALLAIIEDPPYTAGTSKKFWQAVVAALEASGDMRARDGMVDLSKRYKTINDTHLGAWLAGAMNKAAARMSEPRALSKKEEELLVALEVAVLGEAGATAPKAPAKTSHSLEELFQAIVDSPDDDDARLIYADALSERGDARGELIVLQIERAAGRATPERADMEREKFAPGSAQLKAWAAPIATAADGVRFERGFPANVALAQKGLAHVVDAVEWGTVHTLRQIAYGPVKAVTALLDGDRARNLTKVSGLSGKLLDKLKRPSFPWRHVTLLNEGQVGNNGRLDARHIARFPEIEMLFIDGSGVLGPELFASPTLKRVQLNELDASASADLFASCPKLEWLSLGSDLDAHRFAGLSVRELSVQTSIAGGAAWLEALPSVKHLDVSFEADPEWEELARLFERRPSLERVSFYRYRGSLTARVERAPEGGLVLTLPPADRWAGFIEEIAGLAPRLGAIGISSIVVHPKAPRHERPPMKPEDVAALRAAWSDRLQFVEVL